MPDYSHTQKAPLYLLVCGTAIAFFVGAWIIYDEFPGAFILGEGGVLMVFAGMTFHHLTVMNQSDRLAIRFGPIPLFRRTVRYTDIEDMLILDPIHEVDASGWPHRAPD